MVFSAVTITIVLTSWHLQRQAVVHTPVLSNRMLGAARGAVLGFL